MTGTASLELSLWFPEHRVSNLDITRIENEVLSSLEYLFCDFQGHVDLQDNLCVVKGGVMNANTSQTNGNAPPMDVQRTPQLLPINSVDQTILLVPSVIHLEERYAYEGERDSWTTWRVSFETFQLGLPLLQSVPFSIDQDEVLSSEEVFGAGIQEIQRIMETFMAMSIQTGDFDRILESRVKDVPVRSSSVGEELDTFDFGAWNQNQTISVVDPVLKDPSDSPDESESLSDQNKMIIIIVSAATLFAVVALGMYTYLAPRRRRAQWNKERKVHIIDINDNVEPKEQPCRPPETVTLCNATVGSKPNLGAHIDRVGRSPVPVQSVNCGRSFNDQRSARSAISSFGDYNEWSVDGEDVTKTFCL